MTIADVVQRGTGRSMGNREDEETEERSSCRERCGGATATLHTSTAESDLIKS